MKWAPGAHFTKHLKPKICGKLHTICMELMKILGWRSLVKRAPGLDFLCFDLRIIKDNYRGKRI